ncbi:MAG: hypothetical protein K2O80_01015, partial [Helicobacter apodemus]|nr:hypothetical protein [Helicobacter apodemus]
KSEGNNRTGLNILGGSSISNFENSGSISDVSLNHVSSNYWAGSNGQKVTIENFTNSGTIFHHKQKSLSVRHADIKTLTNSGLIQNIADDNVTLYGAKINTFTNTGTIQGPAHINMRIYASTVDNFTNKGTIENTGTALANSPSKTSVDIGRSTIGTFTNEGIIKGGRGVAVRASTIQTIINKGTIETTGKHSQAGAFTVYGEPNKQVSKIKTFINEGVLISANSSGIVYTVGNSIETIINKGTIKAKDNAISVTKLYVPNLDTGKDNEKIGKIILEEGSSLESQKSAISIDIQGTSKKLELGGIEVKKGSTIKSQSGAAIAVAANNQITGNIDIAGKIEAPTGISNQGKIEASISASGDTPLVIENKGNGSIGGSISASDNVPLSITNSGSGSIGGNITSSS